MGDADGVIVGVWEGVSVTFEAVGASVTLGARDGLADWEGSTDSVGAKDGASEAADGADDVVGDAVACSEGELDSDGAALGESDNASSVGERDGISLSRMLGDTDGA